MSNPKVLDFSAPAEDAITIVFPDGVTTCELPTVDELSMSALQFLTSSGEEWFELFGKGTLTATERKRFEHLNQACVRALCDGVPQSKIDTLNSRQKAKIIVGFMTASPEIAAQLQTIAAAGPSTSGS